jgi:DNA mismatch repair protein MutL
LGKNISDELIPVYYGGVNLKISGFIGKPSLSRANRSMQYFFVNNRPISSHVLSYAVKQAYHSLLVKERHPVFLIKFELEPSLVDVNCHPRKTEVKFRDEREVYRVISMACGKALEEAVLAPKFEQHNLNYYQERRPGVAVQSGNTPEVVAFPYPPEFKSVEKVEVGSQLGAENKPFEMNHNAEQLSWQEQSRTVVDSSEATANEQILTVLGQLNNSFILCQRGNDLAIVDQHAAHERIRYNHLISENENSEKAVQPLLIPINIDLSPADIAVLDANKTVLDEVGLKLEHFGGNTFAISEVPSFLVKTNLEKLLLGLIDDLRNTEGNLQDHKGDLFARKEKILTYMACRSAVKFGDPLSREEMVALVEQLEKTTFGNATCPHGRPIMVILENSELWSRFGRRYVGFGEKERFGGVNC